MKKAYNSPEFEITRLTMESIMQEIGGSDPEVVPSAGDSWDDLE